MSARLQILHTKWDGAAAWEAAMGCDSSLLVHCVLAIGMPESASRTYSDVCSFWVVFSDLLRAGWSALCAQAWIQSCLLTEVTKCLFVHVALLVCCRFVLKGMLFYKVISFLHFINDIVFFKSVVKIPPAFVIGCFLQTMFLFKALIFIVTGQL